MIAYLTFPPSTTIRTENYNNFSQSRIMKNFAFPLKKILRILPSSAKIYSKDFDEIFGWLTNLTILDIFKGEFHK